MRTSIRTTIALALAVLGLGAAPAASPSVSRHMALNRAKDSSAAARAHAIAEAGGWGEIPAERLQELADATRAVAVRRRLAATPNGILVLMTGLSADSDGQAATHICNIFGFNQQQAWDAAPEVEQWVGLPPERVEGAVRMWTFDIVDGRRVPLADDAPPSAGYAIVITTQPTTFRYELARNRPAY